MTAAERGDGPATGDLLAGLLAQMPDPLSAVHVGALETELGA